MEKIGSVTYADVTHDVYDNTNPKIRHLITYQASTDSYVIPKNIYTYFKFNENFELFTTMSLAFRKKMKMFQIFIFVMLVLTVAATNFLALGTTITLLIAFGFVVVYSVYMSKTAMKLSKEYIECFTPEDKEVIVENIKSLKYDDLLRVRNGIVSINHEKHLCETIVYLIHKDSIK